MATSALTCAALLFGSVAATAAADDRARLPEQPQRLLSPQRPTESLANVRQAATWRQRTLDAVREQGRLVVAGDDGATVSASATAVPTVAAGSMPDVTGDGRDDVLEVTYRPRTYVAREGRTGRVLWRMSAAGLFGAQYARLGSPARAALLADSWTEDASGALTSSGVVALDARTGKTLWSWSLPSVSQGAASGVDALTYVLQQGILAVRGSADDVLVGMLGLAATPIGLAGATTPLVLAGQDGARRHAGVPIAGDDLAWLYAVGDVDLDGRSDFAAAVSGSTTQVSVRSAATGAPLWNVASASSAIGVFVQSMPDVTGDRRPEVIVAAASWDGPGSVTVYRGDTGAVVWTVPGGGFNIAGDINRDGLPDVEVASFSFAGETIEFAGVSGRDGKNIWQSPVALPELVGDGGFSIGAQPAGDLDGDRLEDIIVRLDVTGRHPYTREVVVRGRDGKQQTFTTLIGEPLYARLGAATDALVDADVGRNQLMITNRTLTRTVWRRSVAAPGTKQVFFIDYGRLGLSRDGADLLISSYGTSGGDVLVMDGQRGALRWRIHVA